MEYRPLEITVISAENLKDVNLISKMDVYVVVSIADNPSTRRRTRVDKDGGKSPKWNDRLSLSVDNAALAWNPNLPLVFRLRSERPLGDKDIGAVTVPVKELLDAGCADERVVEYRVRTPSGKPKGTFKFSYKFGEKMAHATPAPAPVKSKKSDEPVTAYPAAAHAGASTAYPPPQQQYGGYAPPPPTYAAPQHGYGVAYPQPPPQYYSAGAAPAYGYPPQQGYGYPLQGVVQPQQQKKKKKNNFGLGLGAGLLGGLLVGDMISDVGEMGAYDAGFDDAGFDF